MNNKLTQIEKDNLLKLYKEDFANFFNVSYDGDKYMFNINKNMYFSNIENLALSYYHNYEVQSNDNWSTISYKQYNTIELWWLICRVNQIWDATVNPKPGNILKILNQEVVDEIINSIR